MLHLGFTGGLIAISLICALFGLLSRKEGFVQLGILLLLVAIVPYILAFLPIPPMFSRLANIILIVYCINIVTKIANR